MTKKKRVRAHTFRKKRVRAHTFRAVATDIVPEKKRMRGRIFKVTVKFLLHRLKKYFKDALGAVFIVQSQILLVACACLLVQGNSAMANEVAVYAYYLLVIGVVLQLVSFVRSGKDKKTSE